MKLENNLWFAMYVVKKTFQTGKRQDEQDESGWLMMGKGDRTENGRYGLFACLGRDALTCCCGKKNERRSLTHVSQTIEVR